MSGSKAIKVTLYFFVPLDPTVVKGDLIIVATENED